MYIIACDPGNEGGVVLLQEGTIINQYTIPKYYFKKDKNKTKSKSIDWSAFEKFTYWSTVDLKPIPVRERVRSGFGHGKSTGETLSYFCGVWDGWWKALDPKQIVHWDWHDLVYEDTDIVYKPGATKKRKSDILYKETSRNAAARIWPSHDFMYGDNEQPSGRREIWPDGMVEAALIGYAYYMILKTGNNLPGVFSREQYPGRTTQHKTFLQKVKSDFKKT